MRVIKANYRMSGIIIRLEVAVEAGAEDALDVAGDRVDVEFLAQTLVLHHGAELDSRIGGVHVEEVPQQAHGNERPPLV